MCRRFPGTLAVWLLLANGAAHAPPRSPRKIYREAIPEGATV